LTFTNYLSFVHSVPKFNGVVHNAEVRQLKMRDNGMILNDDLIRCRTKLFWGVIQYIFERIQENHETIRSP